MPVFSFAKLRQPVDLKSYPTSDKTNLQTHQDMYQIYID